MIRTGVIWLILSGMVLHCANRTGLLSLLYEQRHVIAYKVGLIAEIPIALCGSEYDFAKKLTIETQSDENAALPTLLLQAREIILFAQDTGIHLEAPVVSGTAPAFTLIYQRKYAPPGFPIFHPPS